MKINSYLLPAVYKKKRNASVITHYRENDLIFSCPQLKLLVERKRD